MICTCADRSARYRTVLSLPLDSHFSQKLISSIWSQLNDFSSMPRLSENDRFRAVGMLEAGMAQGVVAQHLNCTRQTIRALWVRLQEFGTVSDRQRSGRPRATTAREDRLIHHAHEQQRFLPATQTARTFGISGQTVRNRLRAHGLRSRAPYRGTILSPFHRQQRLLWDRHHGRRRPRHWDSVIFSDESRFCLFGK